jgi:hypothetical protein
VLTRRAFFRRITARPEARELLLDSLAVGEASSALDLDRFAEHVRDPLLARKIYRHYAEERKHARLFARHLESLGFRAKPLPPELDYETALQRHHVGTPKARLDDPRPLSDEELVTFLAGSKAGEERGCAEMAGLADALEECDPATSALLREIHADEIRHVSYVTEELQRLAARGHATRVRRELRTARRAEAHAHRDVSRAFMRRLMSSIGVPWPVQVLAGLVIDAGFLVRWLWPGGLDSPIVADAMPGPDSRANAARARSRAIS